MRFGLTINLYNSHSTLPHNTYSPIQPSHKTDTSTYFWNAPSCLQTSLRLSQKENLFASLPNTSTGTKSSTKKTKCWLEEKPLSLLTFSISSFHKTTRKWAGSIVSLNCVGNMASDSSTLVLLPALKLEFVVAIGEFRKGLRCVWFRRTWCSA